MKNNQNLLNAALEAFSKKKVGDEIIEAMRIKEREQDFKVTTAKTKEVFSKQFGIEPNKVESQRVIIDDFISIYCRNPFADYEPNIDWKIEKKCKNFNSEDPEHPTVTDVWMHNLADLGQFLQDKTIGELCWSCQNTKAQEKPKPTTEEQLLILLKQFIAENSYQGEF